MMTFGDMLFSFEGRLRRRDWWLLSILLFVFQMVVTAVAGVLLIGLPQMAAESRMNSHILSPWTVLCVGIDLLLAWPSLALIIKRRHDRGDSGVLFVVLNFTWLAVTYLPASLLGGGAQASLALNLVTGAISLTLGVAFLIVLGVLDGTPGPNRYGPSPKGEETAGAYA